EDGIRDRNVTGVQTCALPILIKAQSVLNVETLQPGQHLIGRQRTREVGILPTVTADPQSRIDKLLGVQAFRGGPHTQGVDELDQIGRASCREGAYRAAVDVEW